MTEKNSYEKLAAINVNDKTEKKGRFTYLSWAWAADQLLRQDPKATWTYGEPLKLGDGSMIIFCTVTAFDKTMTCQMPVLNHQNKSIPNPNSFDVNTAMMRGLAKCIALHGLGLYIYAGEDLPTDDGATGAEPKKAEPAQCLADYEKEMEATKSAGGVQQVAKKYSASVESWNEKDQEEAARIYHARIADFTGT